MRLLLGVTGGIAAYKAADLASKAVKDGFVIRVVMTEAATRFVAPMTFEALTGEPVMTSAWGTSRPEPGQPGGESTIDHIRWAKWAQVACIVPLTASTLGRLACGLADDALTTVWLALPASVPSVLFPAMNTEMWLNPIVQRNVGWIEEHGRHRVVRPVEKRLACGDLGVGALPEVPEILTELRGERDRLQRL